MRLAQVHDHTVDVAFSVGPLVLRVVLLVAVGVVTSFALLRPFVADLGERAVEGVPAFAFIAVLLGLVLTDGLDVPYPAAVVMLGAIVLPLAYSKPSPRQQRMAALVHVRRAAPWVLLLGGAGALAAFSRAWLGIGETDAAPVSLYTGLLIGIVGLSWLALCTPQSRWVALAIHVGAWFLANAVVAGTLHVAVLTLSG